MAPGRSCGERLCWELRQEAAGKQGLPPPPVPPPGPTGHGNCRHTRNSSAPRQAGFPEEPAFKQARLTKTGPRRNTPDQNNWLAHGRRHPLCWGTGWNSKRPSAVTLSDGGHTPWDPGIRGQRGPPQDLARNGHERSLCAPRLSRTEIPHCRSWVTKSNSSGKAEGLTQTLPGYKGPRGVWGAQESWQGWQKPLL